MGIYKANSSELNPDVFFQTNEVLRELETIDNSLVNIYAGHVRDIERVIGNSIKSNNQKFTTVIRDSVSLWLMDRGERSLWGGTIE